MSDLAYLTIAEASALIRAKKLSPVEWTQALIARVERHDGQFNAFLRFMPEIALADARRAEAEISAGNWRGPLHGVPYGLKDIIDYAGLPTTAHSAILKDNIATADAFVTQELLRQDLKNLLADLTAQQREVITLRYGLEDGKEMSLSKVGVQMSISRERVRQLESQALSHLRRRKAQVREYLAS